MALTYTAIASVTVGSGGAANMEFTSIPATYTDLVLFISPRINAAQNEIFMRFNGSSTGYSTRTVFGNGSSAGSGTGGTDQVEGIVVNRSDYTASTFGNTFIYIPNYAGSANKSVSIDSVMENNAAAALSDLAAALWSNSAAITQITLTPYSGNSFVQYSTATLYGIKNTV